LALLVPRSRIGAASRLTGAHWELLCIPCVQVFHRLCYDGVGRLLDGGAADYAPLLQMSIDTWIPYVPIFIVPYALIWAYGAAIAAYALYFRTYNHLLFRYFYLGFVLMTAIECLVWIMFPARISIRAGPDVLAAAGWLGELTAYVYGKATPWNVFPSAHVAFAYAGWLFSAHFARREHRKWFLAAFVVVVLSVLLIKNHFILDIAGSVLVVHLVYHGAFLPALRRRLLHRLPTTVMLGGCLAAMAIATPWLQLR
jgi:membrane-associated phospholipid phosphatase